MATKSRSSTLESADRAAGRLGIDRRYRQGARGDQTGNARARCAGNMRASAAAWSSDCFQRAKIGYSDENLTGALPRLARASVDDVMAAVGRGELKASDVARAMYPDYKEERAAAMAAKPKSESGWFGLKQVDVGEVQAAGQRDAGRRSRSAASMATCRCVSRRMEARCRATASSASSRPARASPSIRSSRPP